VRWGLPERETKRIPLESGPAAGRGGHGASQLCQWRAIAVPVKAQHSMDPSHHLRPCSVGPTHRHDGISLVCARRRRATATVDARRNAILLRSTIRLKWDVILAVHIYILARPSEYGWTVLRLQKIQLRSEILCAYPCEYDRVAL
jgi:hypothetical protein